MRYLSVCSGIEAASVAWKPLGWSPAAFAEIEPFPSAVLAHHYPDTPNHGDMTRFKEWPDADVDLLVGGTPCQSFSIAGLRKGLDDPRGNLALTYLAIAERYRPRWLVWENVPGVLSSSGGRDFGAFLGGLAELGYGFAYRVLDAQYFGVAQRRRRVFVVGYAGDWRRAAAVLLEPESLRRDPPPRRETGEGTAGRTGRGVALRGREGGATAELTGAVATALRASQGGGDKPYALTYAPPIVPQAMSSKWAKGSSGPAGDEVANLVAHSLRGEGFDASEDGTGRGTPLVPIAFNSREEAVSSEWVFGALGSSSPQAQAVTVGYAVRRLTPTECCRLQGFPDDYLDIPYRGRPAADGPKYKALGNSMAVPVMAWIGRRIALADAIQPAERAAA